MAHFAELDDSNKVLRVVVVKNTVCLDADGVESELKGIEFCQQLFGGRWRQTSYNARFRKNYAGIDYYYDADRDAFIAPQPYPSWTLEQDTCQWQPPVPYPTDGESYYWNENDLEWQTAAQQQPPA